MNQNPEGLVAAVDWIKHLILGTAATSLAIVAVAVVGFLFLNGQLEWRRATRVIIGCFLIFGAPVISAGVLETIDNGPISNALADATGIDTPPPPPPRSEQFDPYAGAAIARNW